MVEKKSKKEAKQERVLLGVVKLYIEEGTPIGSQTLQAQGFDDLSSATIRNYFASLEKDGYLTQPHTSGGRVPTDKAFRFYAGKSEPTPPPEIEAPLKALHAKEQRHVALLLQESAELLSHLTGTATFLSSVRFDHDYILEIKLVPVDATRLLAVLVTDFGQLFTEVLSTDHKYSSFALRRFERYFHWRLKGGDEPESLSPTELDTAQRFYNELMVRYLVRYSNFSDEDLYRTGFSRLLAYPEFQDPVALTQALSLFENLTQMRRLLADTVTGGTRRLLLSDDLAPYASAAKGCAIIAIPYRIHNVPAGALALIGPSRLPYPQLFGTLDRFAATITQSLTKSLYKYKLSFRHPRSGTPYIEKEESKLLERKEPS